MGLLRLGDLLLANDNEIVQQLAKPIMTRLSPKTSLQATEHLFQIMQRDILPVTDNNGKLIGELTYNSIKALGKKPRQPLGLSLIENITMLIREFYQFILSTVIFINNNVELDGKKHHYGKSKH